VSDKPEDVLTVDESTHDIMEEEAVSPPKAPVPRPERPTPLATIEEQLLRLQADFTQLAPSLIMTTS